jgi:REP element-mobilizing transposase RayT
MLTKITAHKLISYGPAGVFWQARYYDFKVWSEHKRIEKLRYIHRNPVQRGLCESPEDWE